MERGPKFIIKPLIHAPSSFVFLMVYASIYVRFNHPFDGFFHPTSMYLSLPLFQSIVVLAERTTLISLYVNLGRVVFLSIGVIFWENTSSFRHFHIHHKLMANLSFYLPSSPWAFDLRFQASQSENWVMCVLLQYSPPARALQIAFACGCSRKKWFKYSITSAWQWQSVCFLWSLFSFFLH